MPTPQRMVPLERLLAPGDPGRSFLEDHAVLAIPIGDGPYVVLRGMELTDVEWIANAMETNGVPGYDGLRIAAGLRPAPEMPPPFDKAAGA